MCGCWVWTGRSATAHAPLSLPHGDYKSATISPLTLEDVPLSIRQPVGGEAGASVAADVKRTSKQTEAESLSEIYYFLVDRKKNHLVFIATDGTASVCLRSFAWGSVW